MEDEKEAHAHRGQPQQHNIVLPSSTRYSSQSPVINPIHYLFERLENDDRVQSHAISLDLHEYAYVSDVLIHVDVVLQNISWYSSLLWFLDSN